MNLHEYQSKSLLKKFGVQIPEGVMVQTPDAAVHAAIVIQNNTGANIWAVKAQVHAGGRGKGGGVKIAQNINEVRTYASAILGMQLVTPQTGPLGKKVLRLLVEQNVYYKGASEIKEFYIGILLNRQSGKTMIVYSPQGGMSIEEVAEKSPQLIFKEEINHAVGIQLFQCRKIAFNLGLEGPSFKEMIVFLNSLYNAYIALDATLVEINPVIKTSDHKIIAADAKLTIDNNALYRHEDIASMRDYNEEDPMEVEAGSFGLNFVKLNGNVGCMVNGAGLAMATMDIIKLSGGEPANFLDVGGSANAKRVEEAFRIILKDENVKAILVNIFGGIVRCDRVANGIVDAYKNIGEIKLPIIVRLQGTNAEEAKKIIDESGLKVYAAIQLQDAADLIKKLIK
ncbi:MAG TPA: ADP-forming succinate--CoA ligase subunit beta [Bacteroidales bacterium]|nr:ADP-forming succinate--CoA ligase subunit beta [Bacteroidales bacterium]HQI45229.1 ADP-forming succinate--CoA ligase subunit beta [Bacteroidales bacterium]